MPMTVLQREQILNTLRLGKGRQSTPYRNAACETGIRLLETSKKRPLDATETASVAACIRGLRATLDGSKPPPLTMPRRDDRTDQQKANDAEIKSLYADLSQRPRWWDIHVDPSDAANNTPSMDPELQARGWGKGWEGRPMADCPVKPTSEAIVNLNNQRPDFPVIWADGAPRGIVARFVKWALNTQDNH